MDTDIGQGVESLKKRINEINTATRDTKSQLEELRRTLNEKQVKLQKELADLHEQQLELDNALHDLNLSTEDVDRFGPSLILTVDNKKSLVKLCAFRDTTKWSLIYRASVDGFSGKDFHMKCDKSKGTLVVIKTVDGFIFGGFTEAYWNLHNNYAYDRKAFIFSLVNQMQTMSIFKTTDPDHSIYCHPHYGPVFGKGHDLFIADHPDADSNSYSHLGITYQHPDYIHNSRAAHSFLAGVEKFQVAEIEVFHKLN